MILAVIGQMGAGKTTLTNFLVQRYDLSVIEVSAVAKKALGGFKTGWRLMQPDRESLQKHGLEMQQKNPNWLVDLIVGQVDTSKTTAVVGIREPNILVELIRRYKPVLVIKLLANQFVRYSRLFANNPELTSTQFQVNEERDIQLGVNICLQAEGFNFDASVEQDSEAYRLMLQNLESWLHTHGLVSNTHRR